MFNNTKYSMRMKIQERPSAKYGNFKRDTTENVKDSKIIEQSHLLP